VAESPAGTADRTPRIHRRIRRMDCTEPMQKHERMVRCFNTFTIDETIAAIKEHNENMEA
jgi:hypothetical protein